jgi:hypothetical protein
VNNCMAIWTNGTKIADRINRYCSADARERVKVMNMD